VVQEIQTILTSLAANICSTDGCDKTKKKEIYLLANVVIHMIFTARLSEKGIT
jgi:hypothetical protein